MIKFLAAAVTFVLVGSLCFLLMSSLVDWLAVWLFSQSYAAQHPLDVGDAAWQSVSYLALGTSILVIVASLGAGISVAARVYEAVESKLG